MTPAERTQEWRERPGNRERDRRNASRWQRANLEKALKYQRDHRLKRYGITQKDYLVMLEKQSGRCAICGRSDNYAHRNLCVDHCHSTGKVRGLLCCGCNTALGRFKDSPELLRSAIDYLEAE